MFLRLRKIKLFVPHWGLDTTSPIGGRSVCDVPQWGLSQFLMFLSLREIGRPPLAGGQLRPPLGFFAP